LNQNQNLRGWANLRSRPAIPFNQNQHEIPSGDLIKPKLKKNVCSSVNLKSHLAIPFNQSYMRSHLATSLKWN
jgi:hypothetical protein